MSLPLSRGPLFSENCARTVIMIFKLKNGLRENSKLMTRQRMGLKTSVAKLGKTQSKP